MNSNCCAECKECKLKNAPPSLEVKVQPVLVALQPAPSSVNALIRADTVRYIVDNIDCAPLAFLKATALALSQMI